MVAGGKWEFERGNSHGSLPRWNCVLSGDKCITAIPRDLGYNFSLQIPHTKQQIWILPLNLCSNSRMIWFWDGGNTTYFPGRDYSTYIHLIKDYYIHFSEKKYFIWFNSVSGIGLIYVYISLWCSVWLAGGWCWFAVREKYCWLADGWCWFGVREKHCCWLLTERKGTIVMST